MKLFKGYFRWMRPAFAGAQQRVFLKLTKPIPAYLVQVGPNTPAPAIAVAAYELACICSTRSMPLWQAKKFATMWWKKNASGAINPKRRFDEPV